MEFSVGSYDVIPEPQGLKDGGHIILKCSACEMPLMDIWKVKEENTERIYQAQCCYCGDKSFQQRITGRVAIAAISKPNPNDPDDFIPVTLWAGIRNVDEVQFLLTRKA